MAQAEDIKALQAQVVEMRLRIEQQGEAMAALTKHYVTQEIASVLKGKLPSAEVVDWATEEYRKAQDRKKDFKELLMHSLKLGSAATAAFVVVAMWESFKTKFLGVK